MFGLIRSLPYIALVGALGYGAHYLQVKQLDNKIIELENGLGQCYSEKFALDVANQTAEQTIIALQEQTEEMQQSVSELTISNQQLATERDEYVSIFRKHDLTNLAKQKPGLIEPRINNGTNEVFRQVEEDSRETQNADEDDFIPFVYDDLND